MVSEWMRTLYGVVRVERLSPPVASRLFAYATTALYSGLAMASPSLPSLAERLNQFPVLPQPDGGARYDGTVAALAAERIVLDSLLREALPTTRASVATLADSLERARAASGIAEDVQRRSAALGLRIGFAIVAWSRTDGFDSTRGRSYVPPIGEGFWINDAPANTYAAQSFSAATDFVALDNPANLTRGGNASDRGLVLNRPKAAAIGTLPPVNMAGTSEPFWGSIRPFVLRQWNECAVPEPPSYSTERSSPRYQEADQVRALRTTLAPEQRNVALYWADNAGESGTPVGHWIAIASQMVSERRLSASEAARLMVMTSVTQADAFIASWGYKYGYNVIRPRTYIRRVIDSTWEPLIATPPFPEYPSGHSTVSAAAAEVMRALFGDVAFEDSTGLSIGHAVRRFPSLTAAANEAGMSRLYGGLHFQSGNTAGRALGRCVGARVVERFRSSRPT